MTNGFENRTDELFFDEREAALSSAAGGEKAASSKGVSRPPPWGPWATVGWTCCAWACSSVPRSQWSLYSSSFTGPWALTSSHESSRGERQRGGGGDAGEYAHGHRGSSPCSYGLEVAGFESTLP